MLVPFFSVLFNQYLVGCLEGFVLKVHIAGAVKKKVNSCFGLNVMLGEYLCGTISKLY